MTDFEIRPLHSGDSAWVNRIMVQEWGAEIVVAHGVIYHPADLPGFAAEMDGKAVGLLTYFIEDLACEIVTLNSLQERLGIGTKLIEAARQVARREKCRRLWLITTNDNTLALRFYQKNGFVISAVHINAIEHSRRLKPEIPRTGSDGIPIRDEIELEMLV